MRKAVFFFMLLLQSTVFAQTGPADEARPIVEEGKLLYRSEMASWHGTDLFLARYADRNNIGGYFSYTSNDSSRCVFYSRDQHPRCIGTISFDSSFDTKKAVIDLNERALTPGEQELYLVRELAAQELYTDTLFKTYTNTKLNLIPLADHKGKRAYVLTGPEKDGIVVFGNDYLIRFDQENKVLEKKQLHRNIIPMDYGELAKDGTLVTGTMHSHLQETGEFITATDICTLMLYARFANWKMHTVVSGKYLNLWDCERNELTIIPMETVDKINQDQDRRKKKRNNR